MPTVVPILVGYQLAMETRATWTSCREPMRRSPPRAKSRSAARNGKWFTVCVCNLLILIVKIPKNGKPLPFQSARKCEQHQNPVETLEPGTRVGCRLTADSNGTAALYPTTSSRAEWQSRHQSARYCLAILGRSACEMSWIPRRFTASTTTGEVHASTTAVRSAATYSYPLWPMACISGSFVPQWSTMT